MFKKTILIVIVGFGLLIATSYFFFAEDESNLPPEYQMAGQNEKVIYVNGQVVTVEIADEPQEQSHGLSDRENLDTNKGMLFIFPNPSTPSFWMKDMHLALDMLWIDVEGTIVDITKNVSPDTFPKTFAPPSPIKYVLEVNAGWSDMNNVKTGDVVTGL